MENLSISIIIPVYNAERWLRQCLDSILNQSFENYELILVDDGSKDQSPIICDEYAEKYDKIIVIHKTNGGVSSTRNAGLDIAKGEWIAFIDADDYISEHYFDGVGECEQDLLIRGIFEESNDNVKDTTHLYNAIYKNANEVSKFIMLQVCCTMVLRGPCCKFYRRSLISNLRFRTDMKVGEDSYFVFRYLTRVNSIQVDCDAFYVIRVGDMPSENKYQSSVDYAIRSLNYLYDAYIDMADVHNLTSQGFITYLNYFKLICRYEWIKKPSKWYRDKQVEKFYHYVWRYLSFNQRMKYKVLNSISIFS